MLSIEGKRTINLAGIQASAGMIPIVHNTYNGFSRLWAAWLH
jgi:hypothetical protein